MAGPWEKYATTQPEQSAGPWSKYAEDQPQEKAETPLWKSVVSNTTRTVLPVAGGVGGGFIGSGAGPVGTITGGAGGFAIGEQAADVVDEWLGLRSPQSMTDAAVSAAGNLYKGVEAEGLGLGIAGAAGAVKAGAQAVYPWLKQILPTLTKSGAEKQAATEISELLAKFEREGDEAALSQAQALAERVPGLKFTTGMGRNNPDLVSLERGAVAGSAGRAGLEGVQDTAAAMQAGNTEAIRGRLRSATTGSADDFTSEISRQQAAIEAERQALSSVDRQATGEAARGAIKEAKNPVKAEMQRLYDEIPEYPVPMEGTRSAIRGLLQQKDLSERQVKAINAISKDIASVVKRSGETTKSVVGARRTINDAIEDAKGNSEVQAVLLQIKSALDSDLSAVSTLARTGRLKTYQGKAVYPDKLADELEQNTARIAELRMASAPDIPKMEAELRKTGIPVGRMVGETPEAYTTRLSRDYSRKFGEVPTTGAGNEKTLADLTQRNRQISQILGAVEPGQDVAAKLAAYNRFAETQYFNRFGTESVKKAENKLLGSENVTAKFATPTGVDELVNSIGRPEAQRFMQQHYQSELGQLLGRNPSDAQMVQWLNSNRRQLGKLGLYDEFLQTVNRQKGYRALEKITKADLPSIFDAVMSGNARSQRSALDPILARVQGNELARKGLQAAFIDHLEQKIIRDLAGGKTGYGNIAQTLTNLNPTIQRLFSRQEQRALKDVKDAILLTQRLTSGTPIGGSQTQELTSSLQRISGEGVKESPIAYILSTAFGAGLGGLAGGVGGAVGGAAGAGAVRAVRDLAKLHGEEALRRYFARAMFDPEYAKTLIALSRAKEPTDQLVSKVGAQIGRFAGDAYASGQ